VNFVPCPEKVSSPAPSPGAQAMGITPNMVCGARAPVVIEAETMELRCPRGHSFHATPDDIVREAPTVWGLPVHVDARIPAGKFGLQQPGESIEDVVRRVGGQVVEGILGQITTDAPRPRELTAKAAIDDLRQWSDRLREVPPAPHVVRAHYKVPFNRVFRQWDTAGRLILWVNRLQLEALPRREAQPSWLVAPLLPLGIPVVYES